MRNGNLLKSRVSELHLKRIYVNQGVGVVKQDFKMLTQLKCGFCKKLLLYEYNSDQLSTFFILSSHLGGFAVALLLHPPKSDDKITKKLGNWSELHS